MTLKKVELTLGCILRDEGATIAEWLTFHHIVGFDRFICVLHRCQDNTEEQINLVKEKLGLDIALHYCQNEMEKPQMGVYQWIVDHYGKKTDWLLFLDGDEYIHHVHPSVNYGGDIKAVLRLHPSASAVSVNAKVFGPNHQILQPDYRLTAYLERLPASHVSNQAVKTFIRPSKFIKVLSPHTQQVKGLHVMSDGVQAHIVDGWRVPTRPVWSPLCFNHYYTGSMENWLARYRRGSGNDPRPNRAYSIAEFLSHTKEMEFDDTILRYEGFHKKILNQLK